MSGFKKIEIKVSTKNEATESPWWILVDPGMIKSMVEGVKEHGEIPEIDYIVSAVAGSVEGPFFSREEGETYLKNRRYAYSPFAIVWCSSGYRALQYKMALRSAEMVTA